MISYVPGIPRIEVESVGVEVRQRLDEPICAPLAGGPFRREDSLSGYVVVVSGEDPTIETHETLFFALHELSSCPSTH